MGVRDDIKRTIQILKAQRIIRSQKALAESLGYNESYFSRAINEDNIPIELEERFFKAYPKGKYLLEDPNIMVAENTTVYDALNKLKKVQNGKSPQENRIVPESEVAKIKTYIIPIKGFSGLKKALFADEYISNHFEMEYTEVPREYYTPTSYKIQSTGKSMNKTIPENAWVTGVPIPEQYWMDYNFKPGKIYVLFHPYKGILFKNVERVGSSKIKLCSENDDKVEYPDQIFEITEFRKILLAIKVESFI